MQNIDDVAEESKPPAKVDDVETAALRNRSSENPLILEQEEEDKRNTLLATRARNGDYDDGDDYLPRCNGFRGS